MNIKDTLAELLQEHALSEVLFSLSEAIINRELAEVTADREADLELKVSKARIAVLIARTAYVAKAVRA